VRNCKCGERAHTSVVPDFLAEVALVAGAVGARVV